MLLSTILHDTIPCGDVDNNNHMPKTVEIEKEYVLEERAKVIELLKNKGYNEADIGRILFNVHRSSINRVARWKPPTRK